MTIKTYKTLRAELETKLLEQMQTIINDNENYSIHYDDNAISLKNTNDQIEFLFRFNECKVKIRSTYCSVHNDLVQVFYDDIKTINLSPRILTINGVSL